MSQCFASIVCLNDPEFRRGGLVRGGGSEPACDSRRKCLFKARACNWGPVRTQSKADWHRLMSHKERLTKASEAHQPEGSGSVTKYTGPRTPTHGANGPIAGRQTLPSARCPGRVGVGRAETRANKKFSSRITASQNSNEKTSKISSRPWPRPPFFWTEQSRAKLAPRRARSKTYESETPRS